MRLIKKYKNRRLYDTEKSQYITVEDLQAYVFDGLPFRVEDAASGKDLTAATLLQIFVEMESGATQFLSSDVLRQLILLAHHPMNKSLKEMVGQLFTGVSSSLESTPYLKDYKQTTEKWNQQMQDMMKQWQIYFKS